MCGNLDFASTANARPWVLNVLQPATRVVNLRVQHVDLAAKFSNWFESRLFLESNAPPMLADQTREHFGDHVVGVFQRIEIGLVDVGLTQLLQLHLEIMQPVAAR